MCFKYDWRVLEILLNFHAYPPIKHGNEKYPVYIKLCSSAAFLSQVMTWHKWLIEAVKAVWKYHPTATKSMWRKSKRCWSYDEEIQLWLKMIYNFYIEEIYWSYKIIIGYTTRLKWICWKLVEIQMNLQCIASHSCQRFVNQTPAMCGQTQVQCDPPRRPKTWWSGTMWNSSPRNHGL
jgi:hypothetical protein